MALAINSALDSDLSTLQSTITTPVADRADDVRDTLFTVTLEDVVGDGGQPIIAFMDVEGQNSIAVSVTPAPLALHRNGALDGSNLSGRVNDAGDGITVAMVDPDGPDVSLQIKAASFAMRELAALISWADWRCGAPPQRSSRPGSARRSPSISSASPTSASWRYSTIPGPCCAGSTRSSRRRTGRSTPSCAAWTCRSSATSTAAVSPSSRTCAWTSSSRRWQRP